MQVAKLRIVPDSGLKPAGFYFKQLASELRGANEREAALRDELEEEDRELETLYRRASAARVHTYASEAMM